MLIDVLKILAGLAVLVFGANILVKGASNIALRVHISPLVVGLTIVAFGTSAPELFTSVKAALAGSPDLAIGNVVGSNIVNLTVILGITAMVCAIPVHQDSVKIDWPVTMASAALLYFLSKGGAIGRFEGAVMVALLIIYTVFIIRRSIREGKEKRMGSATILPATKISLDVLFVLIGCVALYFGAEWLVSGAQNLAAGLGVTERVIGLTVVALGTSLPELVTSVVAAYKRQTDLALGNLMGSNIFNSLLIVGVTGLVQKIQVSELMVQVDMLWMLGISFIILPMMLYKKDVSRWEGILLTGVYCFYVYQMIF